MRLARDLPSIGDVTSATDTSTTIEPSLRESNGVPRIPSPYAPRDERRRFWSGVVQQGDELVAPLPNRISADRSPAME